jgi:hypothetical protein
MDFSGDSVGVYAEAKGEYTRQLSQYLGPPILSFFLKMLETAKEREADPKKLLLSFQILLEGISEWNHDKVQRETQSIAMGTQCDYLEELLTAVFVAHTKVLSSIRLTNKQKKLQITIPKLEHFLHKTLIECARLLWMNTYLFSGSGAAMDRQKNMRQVEVLITDGINQGIRLMLPVKSILREYLSTEESDHEEEAEEEEEEEEEEDEKEPEKESTKESAKESAKESTKEPAKESAKEPAKEPEMPEEFEISESRSNVIDLSGTGPVDPEFTDITDGPKGLITESSPSPKVDHTFRVDSGFNPDQFDIFSKTPIPNTPVSEAKKELPFADAEMELEENSIESEELGGIEFEEL